MAGAPARTARIGTCTRTISASWPSRGWRPWLPASAVTVAGQRADKSSRDGQLPHCARPSGSQPSPPTVSLPAAACRPWRPWAGATRRTCPLPRTRPLRRAGPRRVEDSADSPMAHKICSRWVGPAAIRASGPLDPALARVGRNVSTASGPRNEPGPGPETYSTARTAAALESLCHLLLGAWGLTELRWFGVICVMLSGLVSDTSC